MQFPQCKNQRTLKFRRISTIRLQDLKYSPGNCMRNCKAPSDWRVPEGPDAAPVDGSGTWPGFKMTHRSARQEPLVWRVPEGPDAAPVDGSGTWPGFKTMHRSARQEPLVWRAPEGAAAVPVGGGGAWPGFEATRRAKLAARTARGRAAALRHTQRPGPPAPGTPAGPQATPEIWRAGHAAAGDLAGPQAPPNGEASELLVVLRVLVGLAAVGAAKRTDRRHLLG